jgi:Laminin B (Domain IV)
MRRSLLWSAAVLCIACSADDTQPHAMDHDMAGSSDAGATDGAASGQADASGAGSQDDAAAGAADDSGPKATSGFDADADGWTVAGDAQASSVTPDYNGTGGNPGGLITAEDDVTGGVFYFVAPSKYLGAAPAAYGKKLTFDLKTTSVASPFTAYGVMLSGAGVTLIAMMPYDPAPAGDWKAYSFTLGASGAWKVVSGPDIKAEDDFSEAPAATESDLRKVLSNLQVLRIRGEYNDGADTGSLDNVKFGI